jgi:uncharacterized protein
MRLLSRRALLLVAASAFAFQPARGQTLRLQTFEKETLSLATRTGTHKFSVEVARRPAQQAQGLMFRRHLAPDAGMLFLYGSVKRVSMWMKNTYIPLDMIYIDRSGRVVGFFERAVPGSLEVITSENPVAGVLEVNAGTVARLAIAVGDRVGHPAFEGGG